MILHNEIMNIQVDFQKIPQGKFDELPYKLGHRDARHAAAELSLKADARREGYEEAPSKNVYMLVVHGIKSEDQQSEQNS